MTLAFVRRPPWPRLCWSAFAGGLALAHLSWPWCPPLAAIGLLLYIASIAGGLAWLMAGAGP
jgi:hypothetical protein